MTDVKELEKRLAKPRRIPPVLSLLLWGMALFLPAYVSDIVGATNSVPGWYCFVNGPVGSFRIANFAWFSNLFLFAYWYFNFRRRPPRMTWVLPLSGFAFSLTAFTVKRLPIEGSALGQGCHPSAAVFVWALSFLAPLLILLRALFERKPVTAV